MLEGGQRWVAEGVQYDTGDDCPFCGRDGAAALPLVQAFRALFSEAYAALQTTITNARENMNGAIGEGPRGRISTGAAENISHVEYWERQCSIDRTALPSLDAVLRDMTSADASLQRLLSAKAAAPLQAVNDGPALDEARGLIAEAAATVTTYNSAVVAANVAIAAKKTLTASGDLAQSESALAGLEASKRRHRPDVAKACGEYERLEAAKKKIDDEKKTVRAELEKHSKLVVRPYEGRINYFLGRFNAEFKISNTGHGYPGGIATATYDLTIDNTLVELGDSKTPLDKASFRNTLSAGDRTTLALAFFLAHLEREPDLAERIVVFDDPFNSQDSFRRKQTIFEILAQAAKAAQLIVLSHDPLFLKNLWEKCPPAERAAVQLLYHPTTGSKICAFDLDDACKGRAAAELDDLLAYRASGAGNPREIIKKLRIVLETHYRSAFPGSFGTTDNCAAILKKIRDGGDNHPAKDHHDDLNRINDYTADYHHGEDASGTAEPVLDATELLGFVEDTLRMVNALPA
jgi:wobble nucleotide-excising tRNase